MKKNELLKINGDKVRMQYFTWPITILLLFMFFIPYCSLIYHLSIGEFSLSKWLSFFLDSVKTLSMPLIPFIILSVLNRHFFGRVVCVVNEDGIHYSGGHLRWNEITRIEYSIGFPSRNPTKESFFSHISVHLKRGHFLIFHTPLFVFSKIKKYSRSTRTKLSKESLLLIFVALLTFLICPPMFSLIE